MLHAPAADVPALIDELIAVFVSRRPGRADAEALLRAYAALARLAEHDRDGTGGEALAQLELRAERLFGQDAAATPELDIERVAALATIGELRTALS